jgi:hypothetical protein
MSSISRKSRVHIIRIDNNGQRRYLHKPDTTRNARGEIVLWPVWSTQDSDSNPLPYEHAVIFKRRMRDEHNVIVRFAQSAGDAVDLIEE